MNRRLGQVVSLTLLSQLLSAAATLLLPLLGIDAADTYAIAAQVGVSGFTGVVVGIVYNLAIGRPRFDSWRSWGIAAAAVSVGFAVLQIVILGVSGYFSRVEPSFAVTVILLFGIGGAIVSLAAVTAVRLALLGSPALFAGIAVIPNAGYLIGVLLGAVTENAFLPALGWLVAAFALLTVAIRLGRRGGELRANESSPTRRSELGVHGVALSLGVVNSTVLPLFYIAAVSQLPAGTVFVVALVSKLANSGVALLVNSVLLVKYNWVDHRTFRTGAPAWLTVAFVVGAAASLFVESSGPSSLVAGSFVVGGWIAILIAAALTNREVNAGGRGRVILAKVITEIVLAGFGALLLFSSPSFGGYFGAVAISQGLSVAFGGIALRKGSLLVVGALAVLVAFALIVAGRI